MQDETNPGSDRTLTSLATQATARIIQPTLPSTFDEQTLTDPCDSLNFQTVQIWTPPPPRPTSPPSPPDQMQRHRRLLSRLKVLLPRLRAEMRQINQRHLVGRPHAQHLPRRHRQQPLARLQHRQRAQQPLAVQLHIPVQSTVPANVTSGRGDAARYPL